jgi:hypothetical protein
MSNCGTAVALTMTQDVPRTSSGPLEEQLMKMTWVAAGVLTATAAFAFPAPSQAQLGDIFGGRDSRGSRDSRYGYEDTYRIGYSKGLEDGQKHGVKDGRKDDHYNLIHDSKYRKGDAGYKKSYGPRQDYIIGYRDGYEQAYRRGYQAPGRDRARAQRNGRGGRYGRDGQSDRDDPYGYGRNDRYGRDGRDDGYGTDPYGRDDRYGDDPYGRDDGYGNDPYGRDDSYGRDPYGRDDNQEDGVIYEEPPGRW